MQGPSGASGLTAWNSISGHSPLRVMVAFIMAGLDWCGYGAAACSSIFTLPLPFWLMSHFNVLREKTWQVKVHVPSTTAGKAVVGEHNWTLAAAGVARGRGGTCCGPDFHVLLMMVHFVCILSRVKVVDRDCQNFVLETMGLCACLAFNEVQHGHVAEFEETVIVQTKLRC